MSEIIWQSEKDFITFLNNVDEGACTQQDLTFVRENLTNPFVAEITEVSKKIMCTNEQIYHETIERYEEMEGEILIFDSEDEGKKSVLKRCIADKRLLLKIGVPVMLLYNISNELVNGLQGRFVGIEHGVPLVDFPKIGKVVSIQKRMKKEIQIKL